MGADTVRTIHEVDLAAADGGFFPSFLLAHLAWPEDEDKRDHLFDSLCALQIRQRCIDDPEWAAAPKLLVPRLAARPDGDIKRGLRGFDLRIRQRIAAGRMVIPFLREGSEGKVPPLPPGVKKLSINEMAALIEDDVNMTEVSNVVQRVWRPSLPVIHLCGALTATLYETRKAVMPRRPIIKAFADRSFLMLILARAQEYEPHLARSRLAIAPERLERFHMVGATGLQK